MQKPNGRVYKCAECDHVFRDYPKIDLKEYYTEKYRQKIIVNAPTDELLTKRNTEKYKLIQKYIPSDSVFLEVGFGRGHFSKVYTSDRGAENYYCCEISTTLCEEAMTRGLNVFPCQLQEVETDIQFKVIAAFDVLEHFYDPREYKDKLVELLAITGLAIIQVPTDRSLHSRMPFDGHHHYFSKQSLRALMAPEFEEVYMHKTEKGQVAGGREFITVFRRVK